MKKLILVALLNVLFVFALGGCVSIDVNENTISTLSAQGRAVTKAEGLVYAIKKEYADRIDKKGLEGLKIKYQKAVAKSNAAFEDLKTEINTGPNEIASQPIIDNFESATASLNEFISYANSSIDSVVVDKSAEAVVAVIIMVLKAAAEETVELMLNLKEAKKAELIAAYEPSLLMTSWDDINVDSKKWSALDKVLPGSQ